MPPAILAPIIGGVLGIAGMVDQNVQNKAAMKRNDDQQAAKEAKTESAFGKAVTNQNALQASSTPNAAPFSNPDTPIASSTNIQPGATPMRNPMGAVPPPGGSNVLSQSPEIQQILQNMNPQQKQQLASIVQGLQPNGQPKVG